MTRKARILCAVAAVLFLQAEGASAAAPAAQQAQAAVGTEAAIVRGVQRALAAHGYPAGPLDGLAGPQTRAAVRAYQQDAGHTVDGEPDKALLDHIKFSLPKVYSFGAPVTGAVLDVQRELAERGYYLGPHDGIADPATASALRRFRADAGLPPDETIDWRLPQQIRDAPDDVKANASS